MDIVMIPFHDCKKWLREGFRTRDAHLAEHFCQDPRVGKILVINRPTSLAEVLLKRTSWNTSTISDVVKPIYRKKRYEITQFKQKLYCLDTFLPDFFKVIIEQKMWWFSAFQNEFILKSIKKAVEDLQLEHIVLLLQNPMAIGAIDSFEYECFAFDAIDNWLYHPQMKSNHKVIKSSYKAVEKRANIIFTVSKALMDIFKNNSNVYWIANGVDTNFFSNATCKNSKSITIGYVGKIQERVDFDLVEKCLKQHSNKKFIFIGPIYAQKAKINKLKRNYQNIEFTGDIHYTKLPMLLKNIDVAIIPHIIDEFTDSMNPLKLYEYLAAGKPVVTTGIAGTMNISKYIYVGNNNTFVELLEKVTNEIISGDIKAHDIANSMPCECTWNFRSKEMLDKLEKILK